MKAKNRKKSNLAWSQSVSKEMLSEQITKGENELN